MTATTAKPTTMFVKRPNGWRLSGDGGEADGVRCSRGLGRRPIPDMSTPRVHKNAPSAESYTRDAQRNGDDEAADILLTPNHHRDGAQDQNGSAQSAEWSRRTPFARICDDG